MATSLTQALTTLETAAGRLEALERRVAQRGADAQRLRQEVENAIRALDQMIGEASAGGRSALD